MGKRPRWARVGAFRPQAREPSEYAWRGVRAFLPLPRPEPPGLWRRSGPRAQAKAPRRGWGRSHAQGGNPRTQHRDEPTGNQRSATRPLLSGRGEDLRAEGPWFESRGRDFCTAALQLPTPHAPTPAASDSVRPHAAKLRTGNVCTPSWPSEASHSAPAQCEGAQCEASHCPPAAGNLPTGPGPLGSFALAAFRVRTRPSHGQEASQWRPSQLRTFAVRSRASRHVRNAQQRE